LTNSHLSTISNLGNHSHYGQERCCYTCYTSGWTYGCTTCDACPQDGHGCGGGFQTWSWSEINEISVSSFSYPNGGISNAGTGYAVGDTVQVAFNSTTDGKIAGVSSTYDGITANRTANLRRVCGSYVSGTATSYYKPGSHGGSNNWVAQIPTYTSTNLDHATSVANTNRYCVTDGPTIAEGFLWQNSSGGWTTSSSSGVRMYRECFCIVTSIS